MDNLGLALASLCICVYVFEQISMVKTVKLVMSSYDLLNLSSRERK